MKPSTTRNKNGIFTRSANDLKRDFKFSKLTAVSSLSVQNNEMLAAVSDKLLVHRDKNESYSELILPLQAPDLVAHIHLSPTGTHAVVSSKLGHNFYVYVETNSWLQIKKLRCVVTAVGWNPEFGKNADAGPILLGTVQGSIIELNVSGSVITCKELTQQISQSADQRLTSSPSPTAAISDIQLFLLADDDTSQKTKKWMMIIAQMARLVVLTTDIESAPPPKPTGFTSSASLQAGLMNLGAEQLPPTFFHPFFTSLSTVQHTINSSKFSEKFKNHGFLTMHPTASEPKRYAWLSPDGISIGKVDINAERIQDVLIEEFNIEHRLIEGRLEPPTGIALTEYHILLAYSSRVLALSLLPPHDVVFEDPWMPELGSAVGFVRDTVTSEGQPESPVAWLYTPTVAMKYETNDEARYIWKTYLDRGEYTRAMQIARTRMAIEPDALEMVLRRQADRYIQEKNFTAAAEILAQSSEPFESVVLKFLTNSSERKMGLKTLLDKKLERLTRHEDKIRRDALVMWLLNVQLDELAEMRLQRSSSTDQALAEKLRDTTDHVQRYFMRKNVIESIQTNREAVYKMCVAHADFDMQLFFANAVKDLRTVIDILMLREQYIEVLDVLKNERICELTYDILPLLIEHIPKQIFGYLVRNLDQILPLKLAPSLSLCVKSVEMAIPAIKYLEALFKSGSNDRSLHDIYIHLKAKFRPQKLIEYFEEHGTERAHIPYNVDFAMRTCEQFKNNECVVFLYCVAGMFGDAVDRALLFDVEQAKQCALMMDEPDFGWYGTPTDYIRPKIDHAAKKAIWLKIAQHYVSNGEEIDKCVNVIKESNHLISIQDLIQILPKFTKIGQLKQVIMDFLKRKKERLETLERSMKEATDIASEIRDKQERLKNRTTVVKPTDVCAQCSRPLAGRPFNVHSCRHFFHRECLEIAMQPFLPPEKVTMMRRLIADEERILSQLRAEQLTGNRTAVREKEERYRRVAGLISHIVGSECPLCGNLAISQVSEPFMTEEQFAADLNSWLL
ncbi:unnamed protein product [Caenorhabditis sp. 36 PRJEB53466]|nr:unnamed protein product [Caenorhabditis sp. 36 PRJEB53466]